jgi:hypothetical protein
MIKKIISGGQTGADRAALDVAIKLGIPHGGWIPKGRKAEDGSLPDKYQLQEMPTASYPKRTEQNVIDSDGTLIICRSKPTGGSDYTREMALKHKKHLLHIDLNLTTSYDAASLILSWVNLHPIEVLNVAGPRESKDPDIYNDVFRILEMTFKMHRIDESKPINEAQIDERKHPINPPRTVNDAVERLTSELALKDKVTIANMAETELSTLHANLGEYIRNEFDLWHDNKDLLTSSCFFVKRDDVHVDEASSIIIRELWKRLRKTHKLRVVE